MNLQRRASKLEQAIGPVFDAEQERLIARVAAEGGIDPAQLRERVAGWLADGMPSEVADRLLALAEAKAIVGNQGRSA